VERLQVRRDVLVQRDRQSGPFAIAITYDILDPANNFAGIANGASNQKMLAVGGTWDFKVVKLHLGYYDETNGWIRNDGSSIVLNTVDPGADATAWMVGATVPLFGGQLLGSYQSKDGDQINIGTAASPQLREADLTIWSIGYTYPLSRRTNIYTNWSSKDGKKSLDKVAGQDRNQFTLGIRHLF
jgi:predicted porin